VKTIINSSKRTHQFKSLIALFTGLLLLILPFCNKDELNQESLSLEGMDFLATKLAPSFDLYYGPETFTLVSKKPLVEIKKSLNPNFDFYSGNFILKVEDGSSGKIKVTKIEIRIDGVLVVSSSDFKKNTKIVSKQLVGLSAKSELQVKIDGSIGSFINIWIEGEIVKGTIIDVEGNSYKTIKIGDQWWMSENLRTTRYSDGIIIWKPPEVPMPVEDPWVFPYYGWYNDEVATRNTYGALYNNNAIDVTRNGGRNLCPDNWHVPSDAEWHSLIVYLDPTAALLVWPAYESTSAGNKLKEAGNTHWEIPSEGTNAIGFTALPGGVQSKIAYPIQSLGYIGSWWSSSDCFSEEYPGDDAWVRIITNENGTVARLNRQKYCVASVRCMKNSPEGDYDNDSYTEAEGDCNDFNPTIHPGATEIPGNDIDEDCNGFIDCYIDTDNDNFGSISVVANCYVALKGIAIKNGACGSSSTDGYDDTKTDCNDVNNTIFQGAEEICGDGIDQDCNGSDLACPEEIDNDADGYKISQGDCNDNDPAIHPNALEIIGDGIDQDCDGADQTSLPSSFDWRDFKGQDWMPPVKFQGNCGSCYAFSAVAALEAKIKIQSNISLLDIDLSEQEIVSCSPFTNGCIGGSTAYVLSYLRDNGIVEESCFPYVSGTNGSVPSCNLCMTNPKKYKIDGFVEGVNNADAIKKALVSKGPLIAAVPFRQSIYSYNGGIYAPSDSYNGLDAQVIVGYNDTERYWILRPSFGTFFGENGYYRLAYSNTSDLTSYVWAINNVVNP
jgi:uncharacterized protein (TIGR02145 family)